MEVDVLHGEHLRVPAPRRAALRAKHRPEGGLADCDDRLRPDAVQGLAEADGGQGLPLPVPGRRDSRDEDEVPLLRLAGAFDGLETDLRDVVPLEDEVFPGESEVRGDLDDRPHLRGLSDLDVREHGVAGCGWCFRKSSGRNHRVCPSYFRGFLYLTRTTCPSAITATSATSLCSWHSIRATSRERPGQDLNLRSRKGSGFRDRRDTGLRDLGPMNA